MVLPFMLACLTWHPFVDTPTGAGPVFHFKTGFHPILAYAPGQDSPIFNFSLVRSGAARYDAQGAMILAGGRFEAPGQQTALISFFKDAPGLSLTLWLTGLSDGEGVLLHLGNLQLKKIGNRLQVQAGTQQCAAELPKQGGCHIGLVLTPTQTRLFVNGKEAAQSTATLFHPTLWLSGLSFGDPEQSPLGPGLRLAGVALYHLPLESKAISDLATAQAPVSDNDAHADRVVFTGELRAKSRPATLEEVLPYAESLTVYEYRILEVSQGAIFGDRIRVTHYTLLDRKPQPEADWNIGDRVSLSVEPFEAQLQLKNTHLSDNLAIDFDVDLYHAVYLTTIRN